eukprot:TRINITY_DN326_c0_g1::TRINITY_DN326_c0_g1_i1::g.7436::m.7436 TRINITY_DN326_c0_g1::TRINITY_DN326_c0_g1_i1::g.7436  ORF type:complete len:199 (-),score=9.09 TRINITY_DN326_c0_g1_i1:35-631(-)
MISEKQDQIWSSHVIHDRRRIGHNTVNATTPTTAKETVEVLMALAFGLGLEGGMDAHDVNDILSDALGDDHGLPFSRIPSVLAHLEDKGLTERLFPEAPVRSTYRIRLPIGIQFLLTGDHGHELRKDLLDRLKSLLLDVEMKCRATVSTVSDSHFSPSSSSPVLASPQQVSVLRLFFVSDEHTYRASHSITHITCTNH